MQEAVKAMRSGSLRARDSAERAAGVDQALSNMGGSVQRINDMAAQIASACEEQSSVTEEIARNISDICSTQASQHLSQLSSGLAQLVRRFRV
ncbi:methyl-accepting chemotaxis protein [Metapseudomonas resinovorans]